jgi:hypothetical protein
MPAGVGGDLDRAGPGELEHPQRLAGHAGVGSQLFTAEHLPAGADGIQGVALGLGAAGPLGPVDLDHPLGPVGQEARQPSAVAAGPLQRQQRRPAARSAAKRNSCS